MYAPIKLEDAEKCLPLWLYESITLTGRRTYQPFNIQQGFSYFLNHVVLQWPERNAAGALFNNSINVQMVDNTGNHDLQAQPIPPRLFTTPGSAGITTDAGGNMLAGPGPSSMVIFNRLFYETSVLQLFVENNTGVAWPITVDVMVIGYQVKQPVRGK